MIHHKILNNLKWGVYETKLSPYSGHGDFKFTSHLMSKPSIVLSIVLCPHSLAQEFLMYIPFYGQNIPIQW